MLASLLIAAFVLLVVEVPFGLTYAGRAEDRLVSDVERDARVLAGLIEERVETHDRVGVTEAVQRYATQIGARVVVTDSDGLSIVDTSRKPDTQRDFSTRPEIDAALSGSQATGIRTSSTLGGELAYAAVPISSDGTVTGVVRVSYPTVRMRHQVMENWARIAMLSLLVLGAAAAFGWLIARWAMVPVAQLESGAQMLADGDLSGRAAVDRGPPELRRLSATFDEMAARLESLVGAQQAFVSDVSHQLRTPLTVLRLRVESIESALDRPIDSASMHRDLDAVHDELERLIGIVEGLLALARAEGAAGLTTVDVAAAALAAQSRWDAFAEERDVQIVVDAEGPAFAVSVVGGVEQILDNLLDNSVEVAPGGSRIEVKVSSVDRSVVLSVRDHGPGMRSDQMERAIERFWRAPDSAPGGTGLGLAIVSELAAVAGGSIELRHPDEGVGLVVVVTLPATPPVVPRSTTS